MAAGPHPPPRLTLIPPPGFSFPPRRPAAGPLLQPLEPDTIHRLERQQRLPPIIRCTGVRAGGRFRGTLLRRLPLPCELRPITAKAQRRRAPPLPPPAVRAAGPGRTAFELPS